MTELLPLLDLFHSFLKKNRLARPPFNLYEPCDYILSLGGKRLRPAMLLMGFELFDDRLRRALPAAMAVELFHNFSLIHDDIMDEAPLRRGKPTVHHRWNVNTGILSGDVMLVLAWDFLTKIRDRKAGLECIRILNRVAREVCEGQQLDMDFEQREDVSLHEYLQMIQQKTAVLLGGALEMGATVANAPLADRRFLYETGRLAGLAFQIQDDLLDSFGDPEKFGKQVGGDIIQNKKTWLVLKTLEIASPADRAELKTWMNSTVADSPEKVEAVKTIFLKNDIPALAELAKRQFSAEAFKNLEAVGVEKSRKRVLEKTLEELVGRDF